AARWPNTSKKRPRATGRRSSIPLEGSGNRVTARPGGSAPSRGAAHTRSATATAFARPTQPSVGRAPREGQGVESRQMQKKLLDGHETGCLASNQVTQSATTVLSGAR